MTNTHSTYIIEIETTCYTYRTVCTKTYIGNTAEEISDCLTDFMNKNYDKYFSDLSQYNNKQNIEEIFDDDIWKSDNPEEIKEFIYWSLSAEAIKIHIDQSQPSILFEPYNSHYKVVPFRLSVYPIYIWSIKNTDIEPMSFCTIYWSPPTDDDQLNDSDSD